MPRDSVEQSKDLPENVAEGKPESDPGTVADRISMPTETPMPVAQLPPLVRTALEPFPYGRLLAYHRRQLRDPLEAANIEAELNASPRWRAHLESVRFLDLERAAAIQDGADLQAFSVEAAGRWCIAAAVSDGEMFTRAARTPNRLRDEVRQEWARHTKVCVYCRRMRRRAAAWVEAEKAGLPRSEVLLREWLLKHHYADVLRLRSDEIVKTSRRKNLPRILKRLPPDLEALLVEHVIQKVALEELARRQARPVTALEAQIEEAIAKIPRLFHESILEEIEQAFLPATSG